MTEGLVRDPGGYGHRWLARARRRRLARSFALRGRQAALDARGDAPGRRAGAARARAGNPAIPRVPCPVPCLRCFDAAGARERFLSLPRGESFTSDALFMEN